MSLSLSQLSQETKDLKELSKIKKFRTDIQAVPHLSLKKTAKSKIENNGQQSKITSYVSLTNSIPKNRKEFEELNLDQEHKKNQQVEYLEKKMDQKDDEIKKLKLNKQTQHQRLLDYEKKSKQQYKKSQLVIARSMLQICELKRKERYAINPQLGYFTDNFRHFVEGEAIAELKNKIKKNGELLSKWQLEKDSYNSDSEEYFLKSASLDYISRQLATLQVQLQAREKELTVYKDRLRLNEKEKKCQYYLQKWPIIYQRYQTLELIGSGGFGQVYKCFDCSTSRIVAIKKMSFVTNENNKDQFYRHVARQAEIQKQLNHPNIAKLENILQVSMENSCAILELQYCSGPQLSAYLRKYKTIDEKQAKLIIKQLISALNYLYHLKEKVIHYDLKPGNIIFHNGVIKILDFGLCKVINDTEDTNIDLTSQGVGTYYYLPPQTFERYEPKINSKVDIWSVGVIFYEMLYGKRPFGHRCSQNQIWQKQIILNAKKVEFPQDPSKKHKISEAAKEFIIDCLKYNPNQRLSPQQAYEHVYFKK